MCVCVVLCCFELFCVVLCCVVCACVCGGVGCVRGGVGWCMNAPEREKK